MVEGALAALPNGGGGGRSRGAGGEADKGGEEDPEDNAGVKGFLLGDRGAETLRCWAVGMAVSGDCDCGCDCGASCGWLYSAMMEALSGRGTTV